MRRLISIALLAVVCVPVLAAQEAAPAPAPLAGLADEGAFALYVNEDVLARITFKLGADGAYESSSTLTYAGQTVASSIRIVPDTQGRWQRIAVETPTGPGEIVREDGVAKRTFKGKTDTINLKPGALLFENFAPALMSQAIRAYDRAKGGKQTFPVFIIPGVMVEASLEIKDEVERPVGGADARFTRYVYAFPGVEIVVWAGADGKVYFAEVPSQYAAYVREGYEGLRKADADPLVSQPTHEVKVERGVGVPVRDGVKLATDLYRPAGDGKFPVVLVRTPYKKEMVELQGNFYARRGYVVAVQDVRGRFGSPGVWEPFLNEQEDGYDTIEWLAAQPWSSGKVGMIGGSYLGWVQWLAAVNNPPHLVTIIPNVPPPDPFFNVPYEYGVFFLWGAIWWADVVESGATADLSGAAFEKIADKKLGRKLMALPVVDLDKAVLGKENRFWRAWIEHATNDAYWRRASYLDRIKNVKIPVFHQSGWFDGDAIGTKLAYLRASDAKLPNQRLVVGPWGHTDQAHRFVGDRDMGPEALVDLRRDYLRWFDYWLKGVENGIAKEPPVNVFVMGSNRWLRGDTYPLPNTRFEKWYLASGGKANTSKGDGRLTAEAPAAASPPDGYTYDPGDPTPAPYFYEPPEDDPAAPPRPVEEKRKLAEAHHEKVTAERSDILVYTSAPFAEPFTFAGPLTAVLYASSSSRDTDWFVRLLEVDEKGEVFQLAEGKIRARFRTSFERPVMLKPGEVYEYTLDLWHTGMTIKPGRRLRVEVASASFPMFSRNLNTGGHNEKEVKYVAAKQLIYHDARRPSHVLLPVIP